jgi:hypothetical protein
MNMDGDKAVVAVISEINALSLPSFIGRVFKYERKEKYSGEYIVVNHLPFVYGSVLEEGIVNVNVHVPRLSTNEPNTARLYELWTPIKDHFLASEDYGQPDGQYLQGAYFSFYSHSRPTLDEDGTYYVNVQLKVLFNNLK